MLWQNANADLPGCHAYRKGENDRSLITSDKQNPTAQPGTDCQIEFRLIQVIADETMPVPGFQRHAYMCSLCHDTEQRLFFNKHAQQRELETVPAPVEPASTVLNLRAAAKGFLEPVLAKLPRVRSAQ